MPSPLFVRPLFAAHTTLAMCSYALVTSACLGAYCTAWQCRICLCVRCLCVIAVSVLLTIALAAAARSTGVHSWCTNPPACSLQSRICHITLSVLHCCGIQETWQAATMTRMHPAGASWHPLLPSYLRLQLQHSLNTLQSFAMAAELAVLVL